MQCMLRHRVYTSGTARVNGCHVAGGAAANIGGNALTIIYGALYNGLKSRSRCLSALVSGGATRSPGRRREVL